MFRTCSEIYSFQSALFAVCLSPVYTYCNRHGLYTSLSSIRNLLRTYHPNGNLQTGYSVASSRHSSSRGTASRALRQNIGRRVARPPTAAPLQAIALTPDFEVVLVCDAVRFLSDYNSTPSIRKESSIFSRKQTIPVAEVTSKGNEDRPKALKARRLQKQWVSSATSVTISRH
jgi:hypothetical protein